MSPSFKGEGKKSYEWERRERTNVKGEAEGRALDTQAAARICPQLEKIRGGKRKKKREERCGARGGTNLINSLKSRQEKTKGGY